MRFNFAKIRPEPLPALKLTKEFSFTFFFVIKIEKSIFVSEKP